MALGIINEEWRVVDNWTAYAVSNLGRIKRLTPACGTTPGKILRQINTSHGYLHVTLSTNSVTWRTAVHILVCTAFHGARPSPDHEVAHWDGNRQNNVSTNLRWATREQNMGDAIRHNRTTRGERFPLHKLANNDVHEIRKLLAMAMRHQDIADMYGISRALVTHIKLGRRWGWLTSEES